MIEFVMFSHKDRNNTKNKLVQRVFVAESKDVGKALSITVGLPGTTTRVNEGQPWLGPMNFCRLYPHNAFSLSPVS